jgi:hypothetical protein
MQVIFSSEVQLKHAYSVGRGVFQATQHMVSSN